MLRIPIKFFENNYYMNVDLKRRNSLDNRKFLSSIIYTGVANTWINFDFPQTTEYFNIIYSCYKDIKHELDKLTIV
jgi:hypothetical protein